MNAATASEQRARIDADDLAAGVELAEDAECAVVGGVVVPGSVSVADSEASSPLVIGSGVSVVTGPVDGGSAVVPGSVEVLLLLVGSMTVSSPHATSARLRRQVKVVRIPPA